ncbi:uncharacterized protein LY89DRAFT_714330 [Mollisia scopiformis]|uniref:Uncharacterized protein n=1 Tax=Mollisia scopiformis TaxID=149040 RepID=A0A194XQK7_MOLSC|nr:uncharacterized protein LY89DRAFT_714330 [Mollisia scopiformis]KUJ22555.1 hypothetical protein LY89DRAFT_714330 [Mollisia scopiformis]
MDSHLDERAFEQVETRNYLAQIGSERYPPSPDDLPGDDPGPPFKAWRLNLVALSTQCNLYVVASEDKLLVFVPLDLRNTLSATPDLEIPLPISKEASMCRGSIDHTHPHCVNNMKMGYLGDLEILAMTFDDGDVIAFYAHVIDHAVRVAKERNTKGTPSESLTPFFHQNVEWSAWGLAIHKQSRLIAVGSNGREITVFAFACNTLPNTREAYNQEEEGVSESESVYINQLPYLDLLDESFNDACETALDIEFSKDPLFRERLERFENPPEDESESDFETAADQIRGDMVTAAITLSNRIFPEEIREWDTAERLGTGGLFSNLKIQARLPPDGHNIPSLDITSNEKGKAYAVLATDINGNLWSFNLHDAIITKLPSIGGEIVVDADRLNPMGWGVVVIPKTMFRYAKSPHQALGVLDIKKAWKPDCKVDLWQSCFDITSSIREVNMASQIHPAFMRPQSYYDALEALRPQLKLDEDFDEICVDMDKVGATFRKNYYAKLLPMVPMVVGKAQSKLWIYLYKELYELAIKVDNPKEHIKSNDIWKIRQEMDSIRQKSAAPLSFLSYILSRLPTIRNSPRFSTWESCLSDPDFLDWFEHPETYDDFTDCLTESEAEPLAPDHCAVLMCHRLDVQLLSPQPYGMPPTICKDLLRQAMPVHVHRVLGHHDRLCFTALILPLQLVVVGTQAGRCALLTPTRLPPLMSSLEAVITMRIELFLPLKHHEDASRPREAPLMGLAVAPVWNGGRERKSGGGVEAWRLFLHYGDNTILSYELFRREEEKLVVI